MRAVVQRVSEARVRIDGKVVGQVGKGFLVLVGAHRQDTPIDAERLADRVCGLRVFSDEAGKMNLSLAQLDPPGAVLAVSNFTVYGDTARNRRPSFVEAAPFDLGQELFEVFVQSMRRLGVSVATGIFGADMQVELVNDGPVTVILDVGKGLNT